MKPVAIYQDCAVCDLGKPARVFMKGHWWTTTPVVERRDTPQGLPRFETRNTVYQPDAHDGGDPLNQDYEVPKSEVLNLNNLSNPFGRFHNDDYVDFEGGLFGY